MLDEAREKLAVLETKKPEELVKKEEAYKRAYQTILETQVGLNINQEGKVDDKYVLDIVKDIQLPNTTYITIPVQQPSYTKPTTAWIPPVTAEELELQRMRQEAMQEERQREQEEMMKLREARDKAMKQLDIDAELELQRLQRQRQQELEQREQAPPPVLTKPIKKKPKRDDYMQGESHLYGLPE
jgi:hypothetical protein